MLFYIRKTSFPSSAQSAIFCLFIVHVQVIWVLTRQWACSEWVHFWRACAPEAAECGSKSRPMKYFDGEKTLSTPYVAKDCPLFSWVLVLAWCQFGNHPHSVGKYGICLGVITQSSRMTSWSLSLLVVLFEFPGWLLLHAASQIPI